jgi:N-acetylmuramoyl-L-alanine amidase
MKCKGILFGALAVLVMTGVFAVGSEASTSSQAEAMYQKARSEYHALQGSRNKQRYRSNWLRCVRGFEQVYESYPESNQAPDALYMMGKLYEGLSHHSGQATYLSLAISAYQRLTVLYPSNRLADDGQFRIGAIHLKKGQHEQAYVNFAKVEKRFPEGDMVAEARRQLAALRAYRPRTPPLTRVTGIRHWSSPEYTRIVIDLEGEATFQDHLLKRDPDTGKPPRLFVDIESAWISAELSQPIPIQDGLLIKARAAQHAKDVVRIVLDMESLSSYRAFPLKAPSRIIIDVQGNGHESAPSEESVQVAKKPSLPQQLGLGINRVVIDPGHGGKDPGAVGPGGLREKDVVLEIAKKLERKLKTELGLTTVLTRRDDTFVSLDERTAIANAQKADLFVSIHANANRRASASGVETYVLNFATDEECIELAARENAVSTKKLSDLQYILYDLMRTAKIGESRTLAEHTQTSIYKRLSRKYSRVRDLGVKEAPFYVLIGANMPCILVEVAFISNKMEEKRLRDDRYLDELATGIKEGIAQYMAEIGQISTTRLPGTALLSDG